MVTLGYTNNFPNSAHLEYYNVRGPTYHTHIIIVLLRYNYYQVTLETRSNEKEDTSNIPLTILSEKPFIE